jgi:hypothetical protein
MMTHAEPNSTALLILGSLEDFARLKWNPCMIGIITIPTMQDAKNQRRSQFDLPAEKTRGYFARN